MIASPEEAYRKADAVSRKKHAIRKAPYAHLDFTMRLAPERAWNAYVRENLRISVRFFARLHGLPESTWRRELKRGATGVAVKSRGRWLHPEYGAAQAQDNARVLSVNSRRLIVSFRTPLH